MDSHPETPYPVLFSDGEQYVDAGHVGIREATQFKSLQIELSQKTGVPPHQMSVVLICRKKGSKTSEKQKKKFPINDNTNFAAIVSHHNPRKDKDCFLLVSVRRSRRDRERRGRNRRIADDDGSGSSRDDLSPPGNAYNHRLVFPEKMLLRRDPTAGTTPDLAALGLIYAPAMDGLLRGGVSFGSYGSSGIPMYSAFDNAYPYGYGLQVAKMAVGAICEVCLGATKGRDVPFHPCIYDEVVEIAHRPSPAGPIERPPKSSHIETPAEFRHSSLILN